MFTLEFRDKGFARSCSGPSLSETALEARVISDSSLTDGVLMDDSEIHGRGKLQGSQLMGVHWRWDCLRHRLFELSYRFGKFPIDVLKLNQSFGPRRSVAIPIRLLPREAIIN